MLDNLWCDFIILVDEDQTMWEKYHSLVPLKLWNCNPLIIKSKVVALAHNGRTVKENSRLLTVLYLQLAQVM